MSHENNQGRTLAGDTTHTHTGAVSVASETVTTMKLTSATMRE